MGRSSQSHLRARDGYDSAGETHYPGPDYTYDWANTWPSGSTPGVAPVITGVPVIDNLSPTVGDTLTATPADVTGFPAPTRSWQWLSGVTPVGTDSPTYTTVAGDLGNVITVTQGETNTAGSDDATSLGTDPVAAAP